MNNSSSLPVSASDSRLSRPEGMAPNVPNSALLARQQKLRHIVAWVVGGAALLMCAGLVRAAIRSHSEPEAALDTVPVQAAVLPAAPSASGAPAPDPSVAAVTPTTLSSVSATPLAGKPQKRAGSVTHASKTLKRPTAKTVVARH
jgi:hypothetical protein